MVILPTIRSSYLKSFALALGLALGMVGSGLACWFGLTTMILAVATAGVLFSLLGIVYPAVMTGPYKVWNAAARYFARGARLILMSICFHVIFFAVGRAGTTMKVARPSPSLSLWTSKKGISSSDFHYEFNPTEIGLKQAGWLQSYFCWCKTSGHFWAVTLVPLLAMLASVEIYTDRRFPAGVYTLF